VSKELWSPLSNTQQPLLSSTKTAPQLLVFPRRPPGEHAVEVPPKGSGKTARSIETNPDDRVQLPVSNRSPCGLASFLRNGRTEAFERSRHSIPDSKTPNGIAEVPLTPLAAEALRRQMAITSESQFLFPSDRNSRGYMGNADAAPGRRASREEVLSDEVADEA
jgi:hypothetical protein